MVAGTFGPSCLFELSRLLGKFEGTHMFKRSIWDLVTGMLLFLHFLTSRNVEFI